MRVKDSSEKREVIKIRKGYLFETIIKNILSLSATGPSRYICN